VGETGGGKVPRAAMEDVMGPPWKICPAG
jgi:hypothetical protein